jgi:DNA-binding beta-propeller fold protein YncE
MGRLLGVIAVLAAVLVAAPAAAAQTFGQLTPVNCFSTSGVTGCTSQPGLNGVGNGISDVAVTPDGRSVYVYSSAKTLSQFDVRGDGGLTYVTCIGDASLGGGNPCPVAAVGLNSDSFATSVVVSPDSRFVYTAGSEGDTVAVFRRDATGHLTSDGCIANTGVPTCATVPGTTRGNAPGLDGAYGLAFSPDGRDLLVTGFFSDTVVVFKRDVAGSAAGKLTFDGCLAEGAGTCNTGNNTNGQAPALDGASGIVVSPDGRSVYIASSGKIAALKRIAAGAGLGRLTADGCLASSTDGSCDAVAGNTKGRAPGLLIPFDLVTDRDGSHVYLIDNGALAALKRVTSGPELGRLTSDGCLVNAGDFCDAVPGSTHAEAPGASQPGIAISPDGAHVFTADERNAMVGVLRRAAGGGLTSDGCIADTGSTLCDSVTGTNHRRAPGLGEPTSVAVAPNGKAVYVASDTPGSVLALARYVPPTPRPTPRPPTRPPTGGGGPGPLPTFAGVRARGGSISIDAKGRGFVRVSCPAGAQGQCDGSVRIRSRSKIALRMAARKRKKKVATLARARFSKLAPGKSKKVRFKLTKKARRYLARKRKLKAVVRLSARDARAASRSTSARVTLKAKRKR